MSDILAVELRLGTVTYVTASSAKPAGTLVPAAAFVAAGHATLHGRHVWLWDVPTGLTATVERVTGRAPHQQAVLAMSGGSTLTVPVVAPADLQRVAGNQPLGGQQPARFQGTEPAAGQQTLPPGKVEVTTPSTRARAWANTDGAAQVGQAYHSVRRAFQTQLPSARQQLQTLARRPLGG